MPDVDDERGDERDGQRSDIDFDVSKSMRYHAHRRSFWDTLDNLCKVVTLVSGTAVFVSITGEYKSLMRYSSLVVMLFSAMDIVLGLSARSRKYDDLYKQFSALKQDIVRKPNPSDDDIANWKAQRLEIETDEPTVIDWLERRSSAEECKSRGWPLHNAWKLKTFQIIFSQWAIWPSVIIIKDDKK